MMSTTKWSTTKSVKLPRHRLRSTATKILKYRAQDSAHFPSPHPGPVVCKSDTHNTKPQVPAGDDGSFDEIQDQLSWLSSQPHKHKVVIAGNHEVLLDQKFMDQHPERNYPSNGERNAWHLDWGTVTYLQNKSTVLEFNESIEKTGRRRSRRLKVYGSPTTPQYGISAFQLPRSEDPWTNRVPDDTDILIAHGPPYKHLDGALGSGCAYLAEEVRRTRPRLVVFGHIHVGHGREDVILDKVRNSYERVQAGEAGWLAVLEMCLALVGGYLLPRRFRDGKATTFVNASIVCGERHEYLNEPVVVTI